MDYNKLFHEEKDFMRETYAARMEEFGFKNMGRMELFLWDLELFLQIQKLLGDRVVLKGGAATQFYLPREVQRTSVDIDMLFWGTEEECKAALDQIESSLKTEDRMFVFRKHIPKEPKTTLPLCTYHVDVPSVLTSEERNVKEEKIAHQELKLEFILQPEKWEYEKRTGENIFAVNSKWEYQLLPLNHLFADKLTTLGCTTIGVQNDRMDEQVKQFYDILMLTRYCLPMLQYAIVKEKYLKRAEEEWSVRRPTERTKYDIDHIVADVRKQLFRYAMVDGGEDVELKKYINDFHSLYLNSKVDYSPQSVACGAALIRLMYDLMISCEGWERVGQALQIADSLELRGLSGKEKGLMVRQIRETLIGEFESYSPIPAKILKGKNIVRIFWAVADVDNLDEIQAAVERCKLESVD